MNALELTTLIAQILFVSLFLVVAVAAARRPTRANLNIAAFFGVLAFIFVEQRIADFLGIQEGGIVTAVLASMLMAMPYLLLRLVDDFSRVPLLVKRFGEVGLLASVVALFAIPAPLPPAVVIPLVIYFFVFSAYSAAAFARAAVTSHGVTKRRMQAIATATAFFGLLLLLAGLRGLPADFAQAMTGIEQALLMASGIAFFIGFAPPRILWRAWQEPELRAFLSRAALLPRLPSTQAIVSQLEVGAAASTGAHATIGLWNEESRKLRYRDKATEADIDLAPSSYLGGRAFTRQQSIFSTNPAGDDPENAATYLKAEAGAAIAAPITAGERRLGVLVVYAKRAPLFAENDINLVQLLADQAAVILESRALIDEAARVRAHEEATRLKDDFLSAAAHDLKTPLTTLVAQAQFLERRATRDPQAPADRAGIGRIVTEAKRLSSLVTELLDASRLDQGKFLGELAPTDIAEVAREVSERAGQRCVLEIRTPAVGQFDRQRIAQLLDNLVENALKYSPPESQVTVEVWQDQEVRVTVTDKGIGIPAQDLPHIFERFRRAGNVDDRRFAGMGLGLYICRGIVEQHGGRIWAESAVGEGSSFQVALPRKDDRGLN